jgi:hypothetical protein
MARRSTKTQTEQPNKTDGYGGMNQAQAQMSGGGSRYPLLKLDDGDRARFHFLTNGDGLIGTKFHKTGEGKGTRYWVCLRVLTGSQEECKFCEEGHDDMSSRFAVWVYVHNIMHSKQDPEGEWVAKKQGKKTLFREEVKEPKLLKMAGGRKGAWFNQVMNFFANNGDLQLHIYELLREGLELETEYTFDDLKEDAIDPKILKLDEVKDLPTVEEVLREELQYSANAAGSGDAMGTDSVLGEESEESGKESEKESSEPNEPAADDDLI